MDDADQVSVFSAWAKTDRCGNWHSLPYHLLDVAACAEALWSNLPQGSQPQIDQRLAIFLAGAHDVGKANGYFQKKDAGQAKRLMSMGIALPVLDENSTSVRHGQATGAVLSRWLVSRWGWGRFEAESVAKAVGGHHGVFFCDCDMAKLELDQEPWRQLGPCLLDRLAAIIVPDSIACPTPLNPFLGWLAGFVSVADWLGSHERMTVWETKESELSDYLEAARIRARSLLEFVNWRTPVASAALAISDILPARACPNALQIAAQLTAADFSLAIVEAPTGEGKTEAAFALAECARSQGAGIYFALPTMATANGLHERVENYLRSATQSPELLARLLHSQAWLFRDEVSTAVNPGREGEDQECQAQDWFAGSKRGLLAPYAVGTIDQALIAALRAKHGFVRLFALAGKVVVIDEVHAYDVYMGDLLDVLLGWLRTLNCKVVLLSATLPRSRRQALMRAWGTVGDLPEVEYPCITWIDGSGVAQTSQVEVQHRKPLTIRLAPAQNRPLWEEGAAQVLSLVREHGGLGALVLNTVRDAQAAYGWLACQELAGARLDLFHARFTGQDRDRIEKHVLANYGKHADRIGPRILVATQVVEQSLDLDFDHMVSALAPIDLLIQRAGRLHRHTRLRGGGLRDDGGRDERSNPELTVLMAQSEAEKVPELRESLYAPDVMLSTAKLLQSPLYITEPRHVATAVEGVYGGIEQQRVESEWAAAYAAAAERADGKRRSAHMLAREMAIPRATAREPITFRSQFLDDEEEGRGDVAARTRLEDLPSVTLTLLDESSGHLIHIRPSLTQRHELVMQSVRIPAGGERFGELMQLPVPSEWRKIGPLRHSHAVVLDAKRCFETDHWLYRYDRAVGLTWKEKNAQL